MFDFLQYNFLKYQILLIKTYVSIRIPSPTGNVFPNKNLPKFCEPRKIVSNCHISQARPDKVGEEETAVSTGTHKHNKPPTKHSAAHWIREKTKSVNIDNSNPLFVNIMALIKNHDSLFNVLKWFIIVWAVPVIQ